MKTDKNHTARNLNVITKWRRINRQQCTKQFDFAVWKISKY